MLRSDGRRDEKGAPQSIDEFVMNFQSGDEPIMRSATVGRCPRYLQLAEMPCVAVCTCSPACIPGLKLLYRAWLRGLRALTAPPSYPYSARARYIHLGCQTSGCHEQLQVGESSNTTIHPPTFTLADDDVHDDHDAPPSKHERDNTPKSS